MKDTTLVIMAAGIGSRFGGGIKQLEPVGPNGEIIMDFSVFDAVQAGFSKVIFIIKEQLFEDFKEVIGDRVSKYVQVEYVFQKLDDLPEGFTVPEGREIRFTMRWRPGLTRLCLLSGRIWRRILRRLSETGSRSWFTWSMRSRSLRICRRDTRFRRGVKSPGARGRRCSPSRGW